MNRDQEKQVMELIVQKAQALNMTTQEYQGLLGNINSIMTEEKNLSIQIAELQAKELRQAADIEQKERERSALISKMAVDLGLNANATLEEVIAKRDSLAAEQATGKQKAKNNQLIEQTNRSLAEVQTKNRSIGQLNHQRQKTLEQQKATIDQQGAAFDRLRAIFDKLNLSSAEREEIEKRLVPALMAQTTQATVLEKKQRDTAKAARDNEKAQRGINNALKEMPANFAEKATQAFLYYQAINAIRRVARAAVQTLVELDKALTDIAIVTNLNREETQALIPRYQQMAKEVGLTTTAVVDLSTAFFRQGREAEDALQLTVTAAKFARIAAINVNDAANFLTSAINGFNLAASDSTRIIDRFAALGASAAASAQEIAIALSKVAPAAASAGVEIDNLMAFITKGIETTREAPENIGTAFKTIFARMRQLTDIGKVMEDGMDVNKVESALRNIGVELRDANNEFRDLDDVLIEVGKRWPDISRSQQAYVATTLAGTRQQTRLIALFEDFDRTLELIEVSQNSAGAAAIQHAEFMQGLEAATTNLKTSFQEFITSIANSNQMLFVIDALRMAIDLLNTVFGKLILTGAVYVALSKSMETGTGRFSQALRGLRDFLVGLTKPMIAVNAAKVKSIALDMKAALVAKTKLIPVLMTKIKTLGLVKTAQILMGKSANFASVAMYGLRMSQLKALAAAKGVSVANLLATKSFTLLGKGAVAAGKKILIVMAKLAVSPLALIIALGSIVIALKKISEATDTTNPTIAEFQIRIKKAADALKNIVQRIKDFFGNLINGSGLASKMFQGLLKYIQFVFKVLSKLPIIGEMFQAFTEDLNATEKAAASLVVLTNKIKDLNAVIRNTTSESQKLSSALEKYRALSTQRFLSTRELQELAELERELQGRLGTTATGFDLMFEARFEIGQAEAEIERLTKEVNDLIKTEFEKNPGVSMSELMDNEHLPKEVKDNIPILIREYAAMVIEGFEDASPEVQAALMRMMGLDPAKLEQIATDSMDAIENATRTIAVADAPASLVVSGGIQAMPSEGDIYDPYGVGAASVFKNIDFAVQAGEESGEAYARAVAAGFEGSKGEFLEIFAGVFQASIGSGTVFSAAADGMAAVAVNLQSQLNAASTSDELVTFFNDLDAAVSNFSTDELRSFSQAFPELQNLQAMDLDDTALNNLFSLGGTNAIRNFSEIVAGGLDKLDFKDRTIGYTFEDTFGEIASSQEIIETAEQQGAAFINTLINYLGNNAQNLPEAISDLFQNGLDGISGDQLRALPLEDLLLPPDFAGIDTRVADDIEKMNKVRELSAKSLADLSADEYQFLAEKVPEVLVAMQQGQFQFEE
jgi:TP901 family phage tail tape measure protein